MRRPAVVIALVASVLGAGCVRGGAENPFRGDADGGGSIRIEVRNFNFADATLYALRGSERIRMGIVTGKSDQDFEVDWPVTRPLQVEISLLAGGRCVTRAMSVDPGDVIQLQIDVDLERSPECMVPSSPSVPRPAS